MAVAVALVVVVIMAVTNVAAGMAIAAIEEAEGVVHKEAMTIIFFTNPAITIMIEA